MDAPRILVVLLEEEQIVAARLCKRLQTLGYDISATVSSSEKAVEAAGRHQPDLVLMDMQTVGKMEGMAAAAAQIHNQFRIPVIYLTADSSQEIFDRAKVTKPYEYILKSFEERELHLVVEMALDRHKLERTLNERERLFASTLKSIGDGVVATNEEGQVNFVNRQGELMTGWQGSEAKGRRVEEVVNLVHAETRQAVEVPLLRALRKGVSVPLSNHVVLIAKNKSERPVDDCATLIRDDDGTVLGGVMVFRDVSERKQAEEEVRFRDRAIQAVSQGILITVPAQPDNPISYCNSTFLEMTGYEAREVLGRNCRFLQGAETNPKSVTLIREAIRAERSLSVELLNYRKNGRPFWNALSISPVRDDTGRLTHFVGVQTDVTDRRKLEAQYQQAQKMEAVGRLAGGVAHDFNNLLTVINGYSLVLLGMLHNHEKAVELLGEIHKAGERAAGLTRQLLAYSRKQILQPKVLNLNEVVTNGLKMLHRLIGEDVELTTALEPDLRRVKADPGQLEQVLMNLCVNSRDAMPTGGKITIETKNVDLEAGMAAGMFEVLPGRYVLLALTDTGVGMDEETKEHIFEPFFTTKEGDRGTGLGLATVYGIVKQSDGYIKVYSERDHGCTFKIYLPNVEESAQAEEADLETPPIQGAGETILLAEDEASVRLLIQYLLRQSGYQVLIASNGSEALELAAKYQGPIDLLVTDVMMPKISGPQLAEALRLTHPGIRVLYLSGYTDNAVFRHGILESEAAFLQKPFSLPLFAKKLREILNSRR